MALKRLLVGCLAFLMVFSYWPALGKAASPFSDIQGHYAAADILQLYEQGVISGYKDGKFYPNRHVTRAEFLRMLLETVPVKDWIKGPIPFEQLSGHWAYYYLEQSYRSGLILETEWNLVDPKLGERMTRAEAALLLARAMGLKASPTINNPFKDLTKSLEKETNAVLALNQAGIISGMTEDTYGPDQQLTRGQVSKILILVQQLQKKELEQRLYLQAELKEIKGDVKVVMKQGTRAGKVGEVLPVGTELQTGPQSSATLILSDGDVLYVDANSRLTIQELDIALQGDKSGQLKAQEFKILEEAILLRGKADEKNIGLNWQTDKKVNDYSIFKARNETVDPSGKPTVKGSKSTKWLDTDIEPGHTYHYQVVGATGPNEGWGSKEVSFEVVKKASFKLWTGNVFAKVKSLFSPNSKFEVQTPTTTAGVRGTSFSVSVGQGGSTDVGVYSGSVGVKSSNSSQQDPEMVLNPNQKAKVDQEKEPVKGVLDLAKENAFIKNSLAKVINQEKWEQKQQQEWMNQLKKELDQRLEASKAQLPPEQLNQVQQAQDESKVDKPDESQAEKDKDKKEKEDLDQAAANKGIQDALEAEENQPASSNRSDTSTKKDDESSVGSTGGSSGGTSGGSNNEDNNPTPTIPSTTRTISGTVYLPTGVEVPYGGLKVYVQAWDDNYKYSGEYVDSHENAHTTVTIPFGSSSASYTLSVPVNVFTNGYRVNYSISPSGSTELDLVSQGYYSLNGTNTSSGGTPIDLTAGNVSGIDLAILSGNVISGTVNLPSAAPQGGLEIYLDAENSTDRGSTTVFVPEGETSATYELVVPPGSGYDGSYLMSSESSSGHYLREGSVSQNVDVTNGGMTGVNFTLTEGKLISGKIFLPTGKTASAGGLKIHINAEDDPSNGYGWTNVKILEGDSSANYSLVVPPGSYEISYHLTSSDLNGYLNYGTNPALVDTTTGDKTGVDLTVALGHQISGSISLPNNELAPQGGLGISVHAYHQSASASTFVYIPKGQTSRQYTLTVPEGSGYEVGYEIKTTNTNRYVRKGSTSPVDVMNGNVSGINLAIAKGNLISGTISLPDGEVAPKVGLHVEVKTSDYQGWTDVVILPGHHSATYSMSVPANGSVSDSYVAYDFPSYNYPGLNYRNYGYYSSTTDLMYDSSTPVNASANDLENIDLFIKWRSTTETPTISTGYVDTTMTTISGTAKPGSVVSVVRGDGTVIGTVTADGSGEYTVTLTAPLSAGDLVRITAKANGENKSFPLEVTAQATINYAPVANMIPDQFDYIGNGPWTLDLSPYHTDQDGDTITYSNLVSSQPDIVVPSLTDSVVTINPSGSSATGTAIISFDYSDGVNVGSQSFNFTLSGPPILTWDATSQIITIVGNPDSTVTLYQTGDLVFQTVTTDASGMATINIGTSTGEFYAVETKNDIQSPKSQPLIVP